MYLDHAKVLFAEAHFAQSSDGRPCTLEEVRSLEDLLGHRLPIAYKEFLLWMGHGAGPFLRGTDVFFQDLPGMLEAAKDLLNENGIEDPLPDDAFIFYMHQGYQFMFFRLSDGDDPPVYFYGEGQGLHTFVLLYERFSDFIVREIQGHEALLGTGASQMHSE
ncbi:MAG: SMI1/KNR4 family protein [Ktedonobacterales bacterium]